MDREDPLHVVIAHPAAHAGAYGGLVFTVLLGLVAGVISRPLYGVAIVAASALGFLMLELVRRADRLALYRDGLAREYRLFSTRRVFAEYESIQDIEVTQSFAERALGIGSLHVNTSGSHGQEIVFRGMKRPHELEAAIRSRMLPGAVDTRER